MDSGDMEALHQGRHRRRRAAVDVGDDVDHGGAGEAEEHADGHADEWERGGGGEVGEASVSGGHAEDGLPGPDAPGGEVRLVPVPGAGRGASIGVGARSVGGLLLVAVVVLAVLGGRWWWVAQQATALPEASVQGQVESAASGFVEGGDPPTTDAGGDSGRQAGAGEAAGGEAGGDEPGAGDPDAALKVSGPGSSPAPTSDGPVLVHVVGHVAAPGVVELLPGARVVDAVDAAGGLTADADPGSVNMARVVVDGEQVWVGAPGEEPPSGWLAGAGPGGPTTGAVVGGGATGPEAVPALVDLNRATQAELEELPGVGPVTAGRILAWREEHAGFTAVEELLEVSGIGDRTLEQLAPLVTVGP
ncbi:helix-hairpin-helix domain-containing protein [uncultured Serinicoccus sp.]|uniref:helix-hairpin-helix domain-containing protein n=1 Tax=uncultured Serinicoccus sp. TaxID=735514 RepID=UPI002619B26B|nr:helix-hairpin-helix domain-containing protein [uncultured Serinicoccus sp.]